MLTKQQKQWQRYYKKNRQKLLERAKRQYYEKRDRLTEEEKKRKSEYIKTYYRTNKQKWDDRRKKLRLEINARKRQIYKENAHVREYYKTRAREWSKNNPEKGMAQDLKLCYGMSLDDYKALLVKQKHGCAICGNKQTVERSKRLFVDHCHKDKTKIRDLLCHQCNFGLGNFKDDPNLLRKAILYLKRATNV
jgi:hypothetical protein